MLQKWLTAFFVVPCLAIFFVYTKANIYSFWLGFLLCILAELSILLGYCFIKIHKAYRDSRSITLESRTLEFEKQYPMPDLKQGKEIYLNKFTDEARLTNKKESVVEPELRAELQQIQIDKVPYKQKIQAYLDQIQNQYNCLSYFNQALIDFGNRMMVIPEKALLFKSAFKFSENESCFVNEYFQSELQQQQKRALFKELKIGLKRPKLRYQMLRIQTKSCEQLQNIVLPTWKGVLGSFGTLGREFREMQSIKQSNRQFLSMIHRKIMQDYQILEKEISLSMSTISEIKQNLQNLKRQHQKLQKYQTYNNANDNIEIIYWFKKQYFDFTNLVHRIKQNQKNYKLHTQKLIYYKAKLASFYQKQQHKYDQIIHTRLYAFLDTYRITLEESLQALKTAFNQQGYTYQPDLGPPRVKEPTKSKNINEIIATEQHYQQEYFERVEYYLNRIEQYRTNLEDLDIFLNKLRSVFAELKSHLILDNKYTSIVEKDGHKERKALLLDSLFKMVSQQSSRLHKIIHNLQLINKQVIDINQPALKEASCRIRNLCQKASQITYSFDSNEGPMKEKYRLARQQLNHIYREIQQSIAAAKQFEKLYQLHSNRIKKILISSITLFVANQKKCVMGYINKDDSSEKKKVNQSELEDLNELQMTNQEQPGEIVQLNLQNVKNLETGHLFSEEYRLLINRFFFVAYTEWSKSQLFRETISKEIYIALNQEINQYFAEIVVEDFEASGLPPEIIWVKELKSEQGQFIIDVNLSFRGKVVVKISTKINFLTSIPVELQLRIEEFYAILRLCFIHNEMGSSWISFVGEPLAKIVVVSPKIGNLNMTTVAGLLQNFILGKLKQNIYPIKKKITIPLYKKDLAYEMIQKRYESMAL